ncbi:MAG: two-component regulator propeller domain-containing protein [Bacteroidales bacterium]|jgi:ligand-binding sensor domain-containing protein
MKKLIFSFIFLFPFLFIYGQGQWQNYTVDDGLASDQFSKYLIRNSGEIWLLSDNGVSVFNGESWMNFDQITDAVSGKIMPLEDIVFMKEDSARHVWLGSKLGLFEFDGDVWKFHKERWNKKFGYQGFSFKFYKMDAQGYIWAFLQKTELFPTDFSKKWTIGAIHRFNGSEWENYADVAGGRNAMDAFDTPKYFKSVVSDARGNFWVFTEGDGFKRWDGESWEIRTGFKENDVLWFAEDQKGNMWIGTEYGLLCYTDNQWKKYNKKNGLSANSVYFLWFDKRNTLWAFTRSSQHIFKGLNRFMDNEWSCYTANDGVQLPVYSINDPEDGNIWLCGQDRITAFNGEHWKTYTEKDGLLAGKYKWVIADKDHNIWAGNNRILVRLESDKWIPSFKEESSEEDWRFSITHKDGRGNIWLGTHNKGLYKLEGPEWINYNDQNGLNSNRIKDVFEDNEGNLWFITDKGLSVYSQPENEKQ